MTAQELITALEGRIIIGKLQGDYVYLPLEEAEEILNLMQERYAEEGEQEAVEK